MRKQLLQLLLIVVVTIFQAGLARTAQADYIVAPGWDLFQTDSAQFNFGGSLGLQEFYGVPLQSFDFGGTIGVQSTGSADTIVRRMSAADSAGVPGTDTIPIEIVALSLKSANPIDLGGGAEFLGASVSTDLGSSMAITFADEDGGTFSSTLDFLIKITGQTTGTVIEVSKTFTTTDNPWQRSATGGVLLDGVNYLLKADLTEDQDFWPVGLIVHDAGDGTVHRTIPPVPAPATHALLALGLLAIAVSLRRRKTL